MPAGRPGLLCREPFVKIAPTRNLPKDFALIIGAMKSGTSSLFNYLAGHPEIAACEIKEPHFFAYEENWLKGMQWYRSLWRWHPGQHKIALEATAAYAKRPYVPHVPERIAEVKDAEFRFIYILRHPFERLESHSLHVSVAEGVKPLDEEIPQHAIWASQYAMQIDAYERFGRDRMLLLFTDDLSRDPQGVLRRVCRFLSVDPDFPFGTLRERYNRRERYFSETPKLWKRLGRFDLVQRLLGKVAPLMRKAAKASFPSN